MWRIIVLFSFIIAFVPSTGAQCTSKNAQNVASTTNELRKIPLQFDNSGQAYPSPRVAPLLAALNRHLGELIKQVVNRKETRMGFEAFIFSELEKCGWEQRPSHRWQSYGEIVRIEKVYGGDLNGAPVMAVVTYLWLPSGEPRDPNTAFYVFEARPTGWELAIVSEIDYEPANQSEREGLQFGFSRSEKTQPWFFVIAHVGVPGPTGGRSVNYQAIMPGHNPDKPRVLLTRTEPLNRFSPSFTLQVESDWFSITRSILRHLDNEYALPVSRWRVKANGVTRIQPIAEDPADFLDAWTRMSWSEAAAWTAEKSAGLQRWHAVLNSLAEDSGEFQFVQFCPPTASTDRWQIGLWTDDQMNPSAGFKQLYVDLIYRHGAFYVEAIDTKRREGCPGTTRPKLKTP